jgi:hypothetical protein
MAVLGSSILRLHPSMAAAERCAAASRWDSPGVIAQPPLGPPLTSDKTTRLHTAQDNLVFTAHASRCEGIPGLLDNRANARHVMILYVFKKPKRTILILTSSEKFYQLTSMPLSLFPRWVPLVGSWLLVSLASLMIP